MVERPSEARKKGKRMNMTSDPGEFGSDLLLEGVRGIRAKCQNCWIWTHADTEGEPGCVRMTGQVRLWRYVHTIRASQATY